MKCPKCQAKLLPVDGQMFCLQCGNAVALARGEDSQGPELEETSDPVLQKAITDATGHPMRFRLPVEAAPPPVKASFASMRSILAPPRSVLFPGGTAAVAARTAASPVPETGAVVSAAAGAARSALTAVRDAAVAAGGKSEPPKRLTKPPTPKPPPAPAAARLHGAGWRRLPVAWLMGLAVFAGFVLVNISIFEYYSDRVYPGVQVGQTQLGGMSASLVQRKLAALAVRPALTVQVGPSKYVVKDGDLGAADVARAQREAWAVGRSTPLPVAGLVEALVSRPVVVHYRVNDEAVGTWAAMVAADASQAPSDAVPLVVGGQAFVVAEKAGSQLGAAQVGAAVRGALGSQSAVQLKPAQLTPLITASAYKADVDEAQARLGLSLQVKVRAAAYSPTAAQIGGWLVFGAPGKGVTVDGAAVAAYVASIPGSFDRASAVNVVMAAAQAKQNLAYVAVTRKVTATPRLASTAAALPVRTYNYCVRADAGADAQALSARAAAVLADASGWALGGRLKFVQVAKGCNFTLSLVASRAMANVDAACAGLSTCQVGDELAFNLTNWRQTPAGWTGSLPAYQGEMINHEVGHWLGFDHAACPVKAAAGPILTAPTVVLDGCSPNWYAVPVETQGNKVLPGF